MIGALATLLVLQLLGEALVYVFKLPLPGPVVGMALLLLVLAVRPRQLAALKPTAQNLLQHLSLLFVPAGVGVIRVSGPQASAALLGLAGRLPEARRASLARLRGADGAVLDEALILWFPGPNTATGEDLAELHCHGGRAVIAAVEAALAE